LEGGSTENCFLLDNMLESTDSGVTLHTHSESDLGMILGGDDPPVSPLILRSRGLRDPQQRLPPYPTISSSPTSAMEDAHRQEEHIKFLHNALRRLASTPPRLILSPATQPRRAAVALILHVVPPKGHPLPNPEGYAYPETLDQLFAMDWMNQPGCVAELVYIRRRSPTKDAAAVSTSPGLSAQEHHVAFPGGRMESGDEGEKYTAMRTTWEELGIDLAERDWLFVGQMDDREITTSLGKRLLMILRPFVFIRTTPHPFSPVPPEVAHDPSDPTPSIAHQPPVLYSIPLPYLLSPTSKWSHVNIDISSRIAPTTIKRRSRRNRTKEGPNNSPVSETTPLEGSPEEAAMIASSGASFWLWGLRATVRFLFRSLVGDMRFSALVLKGRVLRYGHEDDFDSRAGKTATPTEEIEMERNELKLWGLTLGMTLDLLSGMQPNLYYPPKASGLSSHSGNILEHSVSSVSLSGITRRGEQNNQPVVTEWSGSTTKGEKPQRSMSGSGTFVDGEWQPSTYAPPKIRGKEFEKQLEALKDLGGANVWTPSMTSVFPRFSVSDVNLWIWVFGKRYREIVRGWELSMRMGGSNDRRINWSGQALSAFYAAVRKALIVVIILRTIGILLAIGLWGWWLWTKWS
ncbi:hypothetical protein FRB99_001390, partial [Tulasnella sp. 403]